MNNYFFIAIPVCCLVHELSHYLTAWHYGKSISFHFALGRLFNVIPIPRWTWEMPDGLTNRQMRRIAKAGFVGELLSALPAVLLGYWQYGVIAVIHFALYRYYAGSASDFQFYKLPD